MDSLKERRNNRRRSSFSSLVTYLLLAPTTVGGQAVIEGVMMRSPRAMSIAVRRPDGSVVVKKKRWISISEKIPFLRFPFFRGAVVLVEAILNGIEALNFSAMQQEEDDSKALEENQKEKGLRQDNKITLFLTMTLAISLALFLFIVVPHIASRLILFLLGSKAGLGSVSFNLLDGGIKLGLFLTYIIAIGFLPDIKRVFGYHGAEHRSIYTFEAGEELTVRNAQQHSTLHPRCGTSFIIVVLMVSIIVFALSFQKIQIGSMPVVLRAFTAILIKLALMLPIAGISYEIIRFASTPIGKWASFLVVPGLLVQKLTTRIPEDDQVEVALTALKAALEVESTINYT